MKTDFEIAMEKYLEKCKALGIDPETSDDVYARGFRASRECVNAGLAIVYPR